jgi:hypothetical protein
MLQNLYAPKRRKIVAGLAKQDDLSGSSPRRRRERGLLSAIEADFRRPREQKAADTLMEPDILFPGRLAMLRDLLAVVGAISLIVLGLFPRDVASAFSGRWRHYDARYDGRAYDRPYARPMLSAYDPYARRRAAPPGRWDGGCD